jgi:hypothetical protein
MVDKSYVGLTVAICISMPSGESIKGRPAVPALSKIDEYGYFQSH